MTRYLSVFIPLGAVLAALLLWASLPARLLSDLMTEGGWIEIATVLAYAVALGVLSLAYLDRGRPASLLAVLLATAFLAAREMDLHMHLTGTSVLRLSYYLRAPPSLEKLAAGLLVAGFAACVLYLAVRHAARLLRTWRLGDPVALAAVAFVVTAVLAKVLDRAFSILSRDLGWTVGPAAYSLIYSVEECLELALPAIVAAAAAPFAHFEPSAGPADQSNSPG